MPIKKKSTVKSSVGKSYNGSCGRRRRRFDHYGKKVSIIFYEIEKKLVRVKIKKSY